VAKVWTKKGSLERNWINLANVADGGTQTTQFKTVLTRQTNLMLNATFTGDEIRKGLAYAISLKVPGEPIFTSQSKDKFAMPELNGSISNGFKDIIVEFLEQNKPFFEAMKNAIEQSRKKDSTELLMKSLTAKTKSTGLSDVTKKYKGCSSNTNIELFLCEGDSAAGGLSISKSPVDQATFAMRGKVKNVVNLDMAEVLKNEELKALISLLGTETEALAKYKAIVLAADRDPDGDNIINLALGFLCTFYPRLLIEGRIFIPALPLYSAMNDKGERKFFKTEEETKQLAKSWHISYLKGLGELDPADLAVFTTNKKTRTLIPVEVPEEDFEEFVAAIQFALSKSNEQVAHRREFLIL
jgi:DNA gyrase/topoisomerase IV subunit B